MGTRYRHLDLLERCEICSLSAQGSSTGEIAKQLMNLVKAQLGMGWTPEQIAGRLQQSGSEHRISAEFIYRFIDSATGRKLGWHEYMAHKKAKRGYRAKKARERTENSDKLPIWLPQPRLI